MNAPRDARFAQHAALRRVWSRLPGCALGERPMEEEIIEAGDRLPGDHGWASGVRLMLVQVGALKFDPASKLYTRADDFPAYEYAGPGTAAYNAALARQAEQEREQRLRLEKLNRENAERLNAPIKAAETAEFNRRVDARLRELGLLPTDTTPAAAGVSAGPSAHDTRN